MIRPLTIGECDEAILATHKAYLRAESALDFDRAFNLWVDLMQLFDLRNRMPAQRTAAHDDLSGGGESCTGSPST